MPRRLEWTAQARELLEAGCRNRLPAIEIQESLNRVGMQVSVRTVGRLLCLWRSKQAILTFAREGALAIAACKGSAEALEVLAARVHLEKNWRKNRAKVIMACVWAFLRNPIPARMQALQQQATLLMFEHQIARFRSGYYEVVKQPITKGETTK